MKAVTWNEPDAAPALRDDLPEPTADPGQVLVRVHALSLNPVDNAIAAGMLQGVMPHEFPVTLGRDLAGTVEAVGDGVSAYASGDAVLGMVPAIGATMHDGAWAELVAISEELIAPAPDGVDTAIAGAAPLVTVTALMCVEAVAPSAGETVLVIGAAGGVGTVVVQLAAAARARVVAPGLPEDEAYLRDLGAAEVLPRDGEVPAGVDAIVDLVGSGPDAFDAALSDGGRIASATNSAGEGPGRTNVQSSVAEPEHFRRVSQLLADGDLKIPIRGSLRARPGGRGPAGPRQRAHPGQARAARGLIRRAAPARRRGVGLVGASCPRGSAARGRSAAPRRRGSAARSARRRRRSRRPARAARARRSQSPVDRELVQPLGLPREHLVGQPLERLAQHDEAVAVGRARPEVQVGQPARAGGRAPTRRRGPRGRACAAA